LARHAFGQLDQAVVVADVDAADVAAFQVGLVGDGADDVGRLDAVRVADFDAEALHADLDPAGADRSRARYARGFVAGVPGRLRMFAHRRLRPFPRRLQQQRAVALQQLGQGGGDLDRRHVLLALVAFDQFAELAQVVGLQAGVDAVQELRHPALVHRLHAGQLHLLDRLAGGALDRAQHAALARGDEQDRLAAAPGAAGAAD